MTPRALSSFWTIAWFLERPRSLVLALAHAQSTVAYMTGAQTGNLGGPPTILWQKQKLNGRARTGLCSRIRVMGTATDCCRLSAIHHCHHSVTSFLWPLVRC